MSSVAQEGKKAELDFLDPEEFGNLGFDSTFTMKGNVVDVNSGDIVQLVGVKGEVYSIRHGLNALGEANPRPKCYHPDREKINSRDNGVVYLQTSFERPFGYIFSYCVDAVDAFTQVCVVLFLYHKYSSVPHIILIYSFITLHSSITLH